MTNRERALSLASFYIINGVKIENARSGLAAELELVLNEAEERGMLRAVSEARKAGSEKAVSFIIQAIESEK